MYPILNRLLAVLLMCSYMLPAFSAQPWNPAGYWVGKLSHRDAGLEVRVHIQKKGADWVANLDIPSLVYAGEIIDLQESDSKSFTLEFPFGIGVITMRPDGAEIIRGSRGTFSVNLTLTKPPGFQRREVSFGALEPQLPGTLYLPDGEGLFPIAVLLAGSGNANRENWSYSSWVYFYLERGMGAFIYDRRTDNSPLPNGHIPVIDDHAKDVADAISIIKTLEGVDADRIGVAGASRGAWIAMALNKYVPDLAFILLSSSAAATPTEQEVTSILTGMKQDGLSSADLDAARTYLRLYFYVAQTGNGWELLEAAINDGVGSNWLQYVDHPRSLQDLRWWNANMNFDAIAHLRKIKGPVLAIWGGADFITPWSEYRGKLEAILESAGNEEVTTRVFESADHRIEIGFGEGADGSWHWFGIAPGALEAIGEWLTRVTGSGPDTLTK